MKNYLVIIGISGYTTFLKRIKAKNDSEATKITALIVVKELLVNEYPEEKEENKRTIELAKIEPLNVIDDLMYSTDLKEVILYNIDDDKIIIQE